MRGALLLFQSHFEAFVVRDVINKVFTNGRFYDLHVFDKYLVKVTSLFVGSCWIVKCRGEF